MGAVFGHPPIISLFSNTSGWMHQLGKSPTLEKKKQW
jgi:hypothetical protein